MAFKDSLTVVQYHTKFDPYTYVVDNRPLANLAARDDSIADELDKRVQVVDVSGSATPVVNTAPSTWTVTRTAAGDYTVTHNYNSLAYSVFINVVNATPLVAYTYTKGLNSFSIKTTSLSNVLADTNFVCLISHF